MANVDEYSTHGSYGKRVDQQIPGEDSVLEVMISGFARFMSSLLGGKPWW